MKKAGKIIAFLIIISLILVPLAACAGEQGPTGAQGPQGPAGPKGERGPIGQPGKPGPTGPEGDTGARGLTGATGDTGLTGAPGSPAQIIVGAAWETPVFYYSCPGGIPLWYAEAYGCFPIGEGYYECMSAIPTCECMPDNGPECECVCVLDDIGYDGWMSPYTIWYAWRGTDVAVLGENFPYPGTVYLTICGPDYYDEWYVATVLDCGTFYAQLTIPSNVPVGVPVSVKAWLGDYGEGDPWASWPLYIIESPYGPR